jgi:hypothetical protein
MARRLRVGHYSDPAGVSVIDELNALLSRGAPVFKLAVYVKQVRSGAGEVWLTPPLEDYAIHYIAVSGATSDIQIWVKREGHFGLTYSYWRDREEVQFLEIFNGDARHHIAEATARVRKIYGIP